MTIDDIKSKRPFTLDRIEVGGWDSSYTLCFIEAKSNGDFRFHWKNNSRGNTGTVSYTPTKINEWLKDGSITPLYKQILLPEELFQ